MPKLTPYRPIAEKLIAMLNYIDAQSGATLGEVIKQFPMTPIVSASLHKLVQNEFLTKSDKFPRVFKVVKNWQIKVDNHVEDSTQKRMDKNSQYDFDDGTLKYDTLTLQKVWH